MRTAARMPTTSYRCDMATEDTHGLGYHQVDDDPNVDVLIATMDGTARWDATLRLRSWERAQLGLAQGERLIDVGCGLGEAGLVLAQDLGDGGELVGVDASERMLQVARSNARAARCRVRFTVGDARSLDEPDDSFDAARAERTLQWLADPAAAVAEMVRVVRPGGRVSSSIRTGRRSRSMSATTHSLPSSARGCERSEIEPPTSAGDCTTSSPPLVASRSHGPMRRRPGRPGTLTSRRHRLGASRWRASPTTSSPPVGWRPPTEGGSCRRSTTPRGEVSSR